MNLFYASFIPGLKSLIGDVIKERLEDVKIRKLLENACLFETKTDYDKLNFFCFNNIFAVINILEHNAKDEALTAHMRAVINHGTGKKDKFFLESTNAAEVISHNNKKFRTFRIVVSDENVPAAIDENLRTQVEKIIHELSGLSVNRSLPDTEFWFLYRSEGLSLFMKRLTLRPSWEKTLHKGELPPPLAWALCRLSNPIHSDTVLDPFCGYGAIPNAALKHFHINKFIACDNDKEAASYTTARFKKRKNQDFILYKTDFCELPSLIAEKSIDVIITDPPWGQYKDMEMGVFYKKMFDVFNKLLKENGKAVVLCANNAFMEAVPVNFIMQEKIPILLSGKKASIFRFMKK